MSTTSARQPITTSVPYVTSVAACRWMMLMSWRPLCWCHRDLTTVILFSLEHHSLILTNCNEFKMLLLARSSRLQSVNTEHITPVLAELHWLPIAARNDFKIAVITFNLLIAEQPCYLRKLLQLRRPSWSFRSSNYNILNIPRPRTAFVQRSFSHAAPHVWNSLAHTITDDLNISAPVLKSRLEAFPYRRSYQ